MSTSFNVNLADLTKILEQIKIAERHAAGERLVDIIGPDAAILPAGLRTVDGSYNHLLPGQELVVQPIKYFHACYQQISDWKQMVTLIQLFVQMLQAHLQVALQSPTIIMILQLRGRTALPMPIPASSQI